MKQLQHMLIMGACMFCCEITASESIPAHYSAYWDVGVLLQEQGECTVRQQAVRPSAACLRQVTLMLWCV